MKKPNAPDDDWQRIWLSARQRDWSSLVLVPNDATVDIVPFAESLARTGRSHAEWPVRVINATGVQLADVQELVETISASTARGERAIVPVDPISDNPAAIAILHATSAALLIVSLGESLIAAAQTTIETVGRDRMIGSVVVKPKAVPRVHRGGGAA
jgi:hypothetical protein